MPFFKLKSIYKYSLYCSCLFIALSFTTTTAFAQERVLQLIAQSKTGPDSNKIKTYLEISKIYEISQPDSAVDYCNKGMKLAEKRNDRHEQALILLQLGKINALHHHAELARRFENEALSIFRNLNEPEGIASAYDELGLLDGQQLNTSAATQDLGKAMKYYQDTHDSSGILETYHGLGMVYEEKGETDKALTYYLRTLVQYEHRQQKPEAYFMLLERIGHIYLKKGESQTALKYLQEGIHNSNTPAFRDTQNTLSL